MEIRRGRPDDAPELVRLRQVMFDAMGVPAGGAEWKASCEEQLRAGLVDGTFAAFVADAPSAAGGLAACGVATVAQRLVGPANRSGRYGYVQSMVTDQRFRRQGLARAIFVALMSWFDEQGVDAVDLHATPEGEPLYRSFGFSEADTIELRWARRPAQLVSRGAACRDAPRLRPGRRH
jgi:GNAT superfamily N-acetyltransferase